MERDPRLACNLFRRFLHQAFDAQSPLYEYGFSTYLSFR